MNPTSNKSIITKVVRRVIAALLVTVVILSIVNLIFMSRQMMKEVKTEIELVSLMISDKIDSWSNGLESVTQDLADTYAGIGTLEGSSVRGVLDQYALHHDDLFFLYVATEAGDMYMARGVQYAEGVDPRERVWYKMAKKAGHTIVTDTYLSATMNDTMLATAATPIFFGTKMVGVVGVDADVATINEYINSLDLKDGAYAFIIDTQGNFIAHKNPEYMPTSKKSTSVKEVMPEVAEDLENPSDKLIRGKDYMGNDMIYATRVIPDSGWIVGIAYPSKVVIHTLHRGIAICVFTAVFCILLAAGDIGSAVKKVLKPIEKINPALDGIIHGDFSVDIELTKEQDELGMLQQKLAMIIRRLADIIEEQKYVLGEMESGNLVVEDIEPLPGELNDISVSVNSIKETFNDIISDIQFSALNLQSYAMGINETSDLEEMKMIFEELSAEANALMDKTSQFTTAVTAPNIETPTMNTEDSIDSFDS